MRALGILEGGGLEKCEFRYRREEKCQEGKEQIHSGCLVDFGQAEYGGRCGKVR